MDQKKINPFLRTKTSTSSKSNAIDIKTKIDPTLNINKGESGLQKIESPSYQSSGPKSVESSICKSNQPSNIKNIEPITTDHIETSNKKIDESISKISASTLKENPFMRFASQSYMIEEHKILPNDNKVENIMYRSLASNNFNPSQNNIGKNSQRFVINHQKSMDNIAISAVNNSEVKPTLLEDKVNPDKIYNYLKTPEIPKNSLQTKEIFHKTTLDLTYERRKTDIFTIEKISQKPRERNDSVQLNKINPFKSQLNLGSNDKNINESTDDIIVKDTRINIIFQRLNNTIRFSTQSRKSNFWEQILIPNEVLAAKDNEILFPEDPLEIFEKEYEIAPKVILDENEIKNAFPVTKNSCANSYKLDFIEEMKINNVSSFFTEILEIKYGIPNCITV